MTEVDQYIREVVERGDEGSKLLAAKCAPTLTNSDHVQVLREGMNGLAVLRVPDYMIAVHTASGDPDFLDPADHASSMVDRLIGQAKEIGAKPQGLADVIDASEGDRSTVEYIADSLVRQADHYEFAIMNGELAILGDRIACPANISGTMISIIKKDGIIKKGIRYFNDGSPYVLLDPKELAVYMNSDGVGTKTEFYERLGIYSGALRDSLGMKLDDGSKIGARTKAVFDTVEINSALGNTGTKQIASLNDAARNLSQELDIIYLLHHAPVGNRLRGWKDGEPALNVSGSAVSFIDEDRLSSPLVPREGNYLIAIRGRPNPRSNGITDKRKAMVKMFGSEWHKTEGGKIFHRFLAEPSTIFYPVFSELIESGCATSVYHMSGGSYNGKLAKPLARHGLYAKLEGLYEPDWRELALGGFSFTPAEVAYAKWPMGNEGFVTTDDPERAVSIIGKYKLEAIEVGRVEKAIDGITGIELAGIKGSDGKDVYFSGK